MTTNTSVQKWYISFSDVWYFYHHVDISIYNPFRKATHFVCRTFTFKTFLALCFDGLAFLVYFICHIGINGCAEMASLLLFLLERCPQSVAFLPDSSPASLLPPIRPGETKLDNGERGGKEGGGRTGIEERRERHQLFYPFTKTGLTNGYS